MSDVHLTFEDSGASIATIKGTKHIVSLSKDSKHSADELKLEKDETFSPMPDTSKNRGVLFIFGQSGSGKSWYVQLYAQNYKKIYPKNSIYVFSTLDSDKEGLDKIRGLKRIQLNQEFRDDEMIPIEEFKDSLVIFDDVDNISDKLLKKKVWAYMNNMLQIGRHHKISMAITFHVSAAGNDTKMIINEATSITWFGATVGGRNLKYMLDSYLGLDKEQIKKIKKLNSRWTTVVKTYPKVILSEKDCYILRND
jgi:adenosyl cobinamide kinase/adenosyl cobinamide phosphate guanylyltransferase